VGLAALRLVSRVVIVALKGLGLGILAVLKAALWLGKSLGKAVIWLVLLPFRAIVLAIAIVWTGVEAVPDAARVAGQCWRDRAPAPPPGSASLEGGHSRFSARPGSWGRRPRRVEPDCAERRVVVVHWANSHVMRSKLLPEMSSQFNRAGHRTSAGTLIEVQPYSVGSAEQASDLASRAVQGRRLTKDLPDPTIVTPAADHWLIAGNLEAGRPVIDLGKTRSLARTWIGIVTYREIAECLGWPARGIGYADIIALCDDPRGWRRFPCAKASWGQEPKLAFTDPRTSSTGRSALFSLFAIATGKTPESLTAADVSDPKVVAYLRTSSDRSTTTWPRRSR